MPDPEPPDRLEQVDGHGGHLPGVGDPVPVGQPADHHVGVPDRLHLVHVVELDRRVEQSVQVIKQVDHLNGAKG